MLRNSVKDHAKMSEIVSQMEGGSKSFLSGRGTEPDFIGVLGLPREVQKERLKNTYLHVLSDLCSQV